MHACVSVSMSVGMSVCARVRERVCLHLSVITGWFRLIETLSICR